MVPFQENMTVTTFINSILSMAVVIISRNLKAPDAPEDCSCGHEISEAGTTRFRWCSTTARVMLREVTSGRERQVLCAVPCVPGQKPLNGDNKEAESQTHRTERRSPRGERGVAGVGEKRDTDDPVQAQQDTGHAVQHSTSR